MNLGTWSRTRFLGGTVAAALIVAVTLQFSVAVRPQPAMWVVKDSDSTIYLLGTFHMVKPGTEWRSKKIAAAFDASEELWLEASDLDGAEVQEIVLRLGYDYDRPLSEKLSPEAKARLDALAERLGLEPADLEPMRPWMAAETLNMMLMMRDGYDLMSGVDQVLEQDAKTARKVIVGLATPEQHMMILAGLPEDVELDYLMEILIGAEMFGAMMEQSSKAWVSGNVEEIDRLGVAPMKRSAPELYEAIIVKRNVDWVERIADRMQGSGISFVAVGAGHLIGADGLPALLAERGLDVDRY